MSPVASTFLALGDSYTVGEGVPIYDNFPYQTVHLLRKAGHFFNAPEILAKTGWTTADLKQGVKNTLLQRSYDVVSLLIGVNNQYGNLPVNEYALEFEQLVRLAITLAANKPDHVFVFSIPDWSVTPFARQVARERSAADIDEFNRINEEISGQYKVCYIKITDGTRLAASDGSLLAADGLHPSKKEYGTWAGKLAEEIFAMMNR